MSFVLRMVMMRMSIVGVVAFVTILYSNAQYSLSKAKEAMSKNRTERSVPVYYRAQ